MMEKLSSDTNLLNSTLQSLQIFQPLQWKIFSIQNFKELNKNLNKENLLGCDVNPANLFLQQKYYDIKCAVKEDFLFRYYSGNKNRRGYGFPLKCNCSRASDSTNSVSQNGSFHTLVWALQQIFEDAKFYGRPVEFCFCTQVQKQQLDEALAEQTWGLKILWKTDRGDSDYLYKSQDLINLSGSKLGKKKNHINQFYKAYGDSVNFSFYLPEEIGEEQKAAILEIEDRWILENPDKNVEGKNCANTYPVKMERDAIKMALENSEVFNIRAGILFINQKPVAFTMGSATSSKVFDVHFEKTLGEYARTGAYAVINRLFARENAEFELINREEDINIEGLRKAKLSYKPEILLDKYFGKLISSKIDSGVLDESGVSDKTGAFDKSAVLNS